MWLINKIMPLHKNTSQNKKIRTGKYKYIQIGENNGLGT